MGSPSPEENENHPPPSPSEEIALEGEQPSSHTQIGLLLISVLVIALCGIVYQLIISTVSSYLLGNSIYQFSITIGLFMVAFGLGSYLSKLVTENLVGKFIFIEVLIGLVGGWCSLILFLSYIGPFDYEWTMYTIIIAIGTLIGLEIPILTRILTNYTQLRESIAHVLSLDYVGGLIGSLLFPLLLLPHFGLLRASFFVGMLNFMVVYINLVVFYRYLKYPRLLVAFSIILGIFLLASFFSAPYLTNHIEGYLYQDRVVYSHQSKYAKILITRHNQDVRLYLDGKIQFSSLDEYRYHEALVHPPMSLSKSREQVLILGGGDGLALREVLKYQDVKRITLVDLDPEVVNICRRMPLMAQLNGQSLENKRLNLIHDDAMNFVKNTREKFDVILIDLPDPSTPSLHKLYTRTFFHYIRRVLKRGGYMTIQSTSPLISRRAFWCIHHTIKNTGLKTSAYQIYLPSFGVWGFNLAGHQEAAYEKIKWEVKTRYLDHSTMKRMLLFPKDTQEVKTEVNTLINPVLISYYHQGWARWQE